MAGSDATSHSPWHGDLPKGLLLRDRYSVQELIRPGGVSQVYLGRDLRSPQSRKPCVIKVFLHQNTPEDTFSDFRSRLTTLMTLRHPALMNITEHFSEANRDFYVAEYIEGETLEVIIENAEPRLPIDRVRQWAIDICDALSYLHNQQPEPVLLSDLMPSHVMIDGHGQPRLIDFGTGKAWRDYFHMHILWARNPDH